MTKRTPRSRQGRSSARGFAEAGLEHFDSADAVRGMGQQNSAGLLYIMSAIAYADAVSIWILGEKSTSANHMDALVLFGQATSKVRGYEAALGHLKRLIQLKSYVSYGGTSLTPSEIEQISTHSRRFKEFCDAALSAG